MDTKSRQKLLIAGAVICVSLFIGDSLLLEPLAKSWKERSKQIADLKEQVSRGAVLVDHEAAIRRRWEGMRTNTLPVNTSVAEAEFYKAFSRCVQDSGVTQVSYRPQWKQNDDYTTYECRADITGNIETLSRFIYELEREPMALKIDSLEIATHDDKGTQLSLGLQISGLMLTPATQP
jgi:type II secretion system (T2SS) protein M